MRLPTLRERILCIGLSVLPVVWGYHLLDPFHVSRWACLALLCFFLFLVMSIDKEFRPRIAKAEALLLGLALLVVGLTWVSALKALDLSEALWQSVQTTSALVFLFGLLLASPRTLGFWISVRRIALVLAVIGSLVVWAELLGIWRPPFEPGWGPFGLHGNRNLVVTFQVLLAPWIVWACFDEKGAWKVLGWIGWLFFAWNLAYCQCRAAWLAVAAGFGGHLLLWVLRRIRRRHGNLTVTPFLLSLSLVAVFVLEDSIRPMEEAPSFSNRLISIGQADNASIRERLALWEKTLCLIKEHPLMGVGAGQWKIHLPAQGMDGLLATDMSVMQTRPHNDWLWVASEIGWLGGLAWFAIPALVLGLTCWRFGTLPRNEGKRGSEFTASGVLGYMVFATFDFPRERAEHMLWMTVLCVAALRLSQSAALAFVIHDKPEKQITDESLRVGFKPSKNEFVIPKWAILGALILTLVSLGFSGLRWWAETWVYQTIAAHVNKDWEKVIQSSQSIPYWIEDMTPAGSPLAWHEGIARVELNQWTEAEQAFLTAEKIHPYHLPLLNNLAVCRLKALDTLAAIGYQERVAFLRSYEIQSALPLAWLKWNLGDKSGAKTTLDKVEKTQRNQAWETMNRLCHP